DGQGRLYLARYYDFERRLARALVGHAGGEAAANADGNLGGRAGAGISGDADAAAGGNSVADANAPQTLHQRLLRYFGPPADDEVDWQRVAAVMA
ncbi:exodeoxyribonuclease V subunit alpha, partial [bacterium M00.F.Ca.ET.179.01.1.1]